MADEKKSETGGGGSGGGGFYLDAFFWIMVVAVAYGLLKQAFGSTSFSFDFIPNLTSLFSVFFGGFQVFSIFISLLLLLGIIYFNFKTGELNSHHGHGDHGHSDHGHGGHSDSPSHGVPVYKGVKANARWEKIEARLGSINDSDWRLAIIDCDIILGEMLTKMGYQGETIAEKLKKVEQSDFTTIQSAWEAHKIRNEIAHAGSDFKLSYRDAKRAVDLYKKVFEEFYYI